MAAPFIHAQSCVKRYGGKPEDYLDIHELMDSTKSTFPDNRHRALTHNIWFCATIIPKIFGHSRVNSDGKQYNTKDIAELHCLEDFRWKFIPSVQDYLENMEMKSWMNNGLGTPSSAQRLYRLKEETTIIFPSVPDEAKKVDFVLQEEKTEEEKSIISPELKDKLNNAIENLKNIDLENDRSHIKEGYLD